MFHISYVRPVDYTQRSILKYYHGIMDNGMRVIEKITARHGCGR